MSARENTSTVSPAAAAMTRYAESTGAITDPGLKELYRIATDLYAELNVALTRVAELEALAANGNGITYALTVIAKHGDMSDEVRQEIRDLLPAEDPCRPCGCPKRFERHAWGCPTLPEVTPTEAAERAAVDRSITDQFPATAAGKWNSQHPVGTPVFAYPGCRPEDDSKCTRLVTRTRSAASVLGGHTAVVWVDGHSSCISLTHVDPRPETGGAS